MGTEAIAVLNAGSSSIKFSLYTVAAEELALAVGGQVEAIHTRPRFVAKNARGEAIATRTWDEGADIGHGGALEQITAFVRSELSDLSMIGIGHRVVHGGLSYTRPVRVDAAVVDALAEMIPLAPLHQPHNLAPIRLLLERRPELPQVACFDTSFHRAQPELAQMFALPWEMHEQGVRRYGFHGLSYEYIASRLPQVDPRAAAGRTVVLHLGNGSSMCGLAGCSSVASTMGFTAVDGLAMGTRCGALDPGVILYLMRRGMDIDAVEKLIYSKSGLLGVSGVSSDMRTLLESAEPRARVAVDLYVYRICRELGSLAAALGGVDALVFTGGIGENSAEIRKRICRDAAWLGVQLDAKANEGRGPRISSDSSPTAVWVIPTNEELMIARHTRKLVADA